MQLRQVLAQDTARDGNGFKAWCSIEPGSPYGGRTVKSEDLQKERDSLARLFFFNKRGVKWGTEFQDRLTIMLFVQFLTLFLVLPQP